MKQEDALSILKNVKDISVTSDVLGRFLFEENTTSKVTFWARENEQTFGLLTTSEKSVKNNSCVEFSSDELPWFNSFIEKPESHYLIDSRSNFGLKLLRNKAILKTTCICLDIPLTFNNLLLGLIRIEFQEDSSNIKSFISEALKVANICAHNFYANFRYNELMLFRQSRYYSQLRELQEKCDALSLCTDALVSVSFSNNIIRFTDNAEKLFGFKKSEVMGKHIKMLCPSIDKLLPAESFHSKDYKELGCLRSDGQGFISLVASIPARGSFDDEENDIIGTTLLFKDITESKKYQERINQLQDEVNKDHLTGVYNRKYAIEWISLATLKDNSVTVAMLDIDDFKRINDVYGHDCGDKILVETTRIIQDTLRNNDLLSRYGGEEFLIGLHACDLAQSNKTLERIRERISRHKFTYKENIINITVSIGFDVCLASSEISDRLKTADAALYKAKKLSKNRVIYAGDNQIDMFS